MKTVRPKATGVRIPLPAPNKKGSTPYECCHFYFPKMKQRDSNGLVVNTVRGTVEPTLTESADESEIPLPAPYKKVVLLMSATLFISLKRNGGVRTQASRNVPGAHFSR